MKHKTTMRHVVIRVGTEGPKHDPYSFTEYIVLEHKSGHIRTVTIHRGLGDYVKLNGKCTKRSMESLLGVSENALARAFGRMTQAGRRCGKCGTYDTERYLGGGYVGEGIYSCKCGEKMYCEPVTPAMIE